MQPHTRYDYVNSNACAITQKKRVVNFELGHVMANKRTLMSFWSRKGGAGPSFACTAPLASTSTSDVSETDVSNVRGTAGGSSGRS